MMEELNDIAESIEETLDEKDTVRELALKSSRAVIRMSGGLIRAVHRGNGSDDLINELRNETHRLEGVVREFQDLMHSGFVTDAFQEYTEAMVFLAIVKKKPLPGPAELSVTPESYILGIGDVIGEIRRLALDSIRKGDVNNANTCLEAMEALYDFIDRFDYPAAMVAIRRKQDIARSLIEKTRGDVTLAGRQISLEKRLARVIEQKEQ